MSSESEVFNAVVRDLASDGRGIVADDNGRVFFVGGVWLDEEAEFKVTNIQGRSGTAKLIRLIKKSPARITPPCPYHGTDNLSCGGCAWQFVDYLAQIKAKKMRVESAVHRTLTHIFAKKKPEFIQRVIKKCLNEIISTQKNLAYRNRAQFKTDGNRLGFLSAQSRELVDVERCLVLSEKNQKSLNVLRQTLPNTHWNMSRSMQKKQHWTRIDIDENITLEDYEGKNLEQLPINQRRIFQQANTAQNTIMKSWLYNKCCNILIERKNKYKDKPKVLELFCGSGNFTEVLNSCEFDEIFSVESSREAIDGLKNKQFKNITALTADLYSDQAFEDLYRKEKKIKQAEILVLDPPRDGLKNTRGLMPKKHSFTEVLYISCDLATFCRDLEYLYQQGFRLVELTPIDQFPHTPHIELLAHLSLPSSP